MNNNCSTGSSALYQANNAVKYGQVECALALGFERMKPGSLGSNFPDRPSPTVLFHKRSTDLEEVLGENYGPGAPRMFDNGAQEYFSKYGGSVEHLAKIGIDVIQTVGILRYLTTKQPRRITNILWPTLIHNFAMGGPSIKSWLRLKSQKTSLNSCVVLRL